MIRSAPGAGGRAAGMKTIGEVMTAQPHTIDAGASLVEAQQLMDRHGIRHLPVTQGAGVVGILSDRDLKLSLDPIVDFPPVGRVRDIMIGDPYVVHPSTPLDEVLLTLAKRRIGCALVADGQGLSGIFTTTDAARMLGEHYRDRRTSG